MKDRNLLKARNLTIENLGLLKTILDQCTDEGMFDDDAHYYNELIDLKAEAHAVKSWEELIEVIALAKTLEIDIDVWLSRKGRTSLSLEWPVQPA